MRNITSSHVGYLWCWHKSVKQILHIFWGLFIIINQITEWISKYLLSFCSISAWSQNVKISVNDHLLTTLNSSSDWFMTYRVEDHTKALWDFYNFEIVIPANFTGRYVYIYLIAGGNIYIRELGGVCTICLWWVNIQFNFLCCKMCCP